jgi:hypothetical protein
VSATLSLRPPRAVAEPSSCLPGANRVKRKRVAIRGGSVEGCRSRKEGSRLLSTRPPLPFGTRAA